MIWPANSVLRFHCQRALNGTGKMLFCVNVKELGHLQAGGVGCCLLRLYKVCAELNGTGFNSNH